MGETTHIKVRNRIFTAAEIASLPSMINKLTAAAKRCGLQTRIYRAAPVLCMAPGCPGSWAPAKHLLVAPSHGATPWAGHGSTA